jgi:N-acylneuraminate cytidylyltransferase
MEILALIPARGGSKGLPRKNLRELAGKPLVAHSIAHALAARTITRTIVSTDDPGIADVARRYGAEVPFLRPAELAGDLSPDIDAFVHALNWLGDEEGYRPDLVVHLRPTDPLRRPATIDAAVRELLADTDADSLRSVAPTAESPYKMWRLDDDRYLRPLLALEGVDEPYNLPRQELPRVFVQTGYVDVIRPEVILEERRMSGNRIRAFVVAEPHVDIDSEDDLRRAEELLLGARAG